jgi:hypothetical protein
MRTTQSRVSQKRNDHERTVERERKGQ